MTLPHRHGRRARVVRQRQERLRPRFLVRLGLEGDDDAGGHRLFQALGRFVRHKFEARLEEVVVALAPEPRLGSDPVHRVGEGPVKGGARRTDHLRWGLEQDKADLNSY